MSIYHKERHGFVRYAIDHDIKYLLDTGGDTLGVVDSVLVGKEYSTLHGPRHWIRVLSRGENIIAHNQSEFDDLALTRAVLWLFALFHDCARDHDDECLEHGFAGAVLMMRMMMERAAPHALLIAERACVLHTIVSTPRSSLAFNIGLSHFTESRRAFPRMENIVGLCLDADRLDLTRVGIQPESRFMYFPNNYGGDVL